MCYRVCYLMDVCVTGSPTVQGVGLCYLTHSFILRKEEAPICVACNVVLTVKLILIECADLLEIRKKYFEEKSLYSLVRNVIPEVVFDFLREIGVFYKV